MVEAGAEAVATVVLLPHRTPSGKVVQDAGSSATGRPAAVQFIEEVEQPRHVVSFCSPVAPRLGNMTGLPSITSITTLFRL